MKKSASIKILPALLCSLVWFRALAAGSYAGKPLHSIDTGYTIMKVRTGQAGSQRFMIGASYEGTVIALDWEGKKLWKNELSGYMVHDLWCDDLNRDRIDDVLVANADGYLYCINGKDGALLWKFCPTDGVHKAPMYAVCTVKEDCRNKYVACGGFDKNLYYLSRNGKLVKTIKSSSYSKEIPWGEAEEEGYGHSINFLRPIPQEDGASDLALCGTMSHMQSSGGLYCFKALKDNPYATKRIQGLKVLADFTVFDSNNDGVQEFIFGGSGLTDDKLTFYDPATETMSRHVLKGNGANGYRVTLSELIQDEGHPAFLVLCGAHLNLLPLDRNVDKGEKIHGRYAFNDLWKDPETGKLFLASAQSGGSCIHVIDPSIPGWKDAFCNLAPSGKIQTILDNTAIVLEQLKSFSKPVWEREPVPVYLPGSDHARAVEIKENYPSPVFIGGYWHRGRVQNTDWRDDPENAIENAKYKRKKDARNKYVLTQEQILKEVVPEYKGEKAIEFWAGHGNGPNYYAPDTLQKILDKADGTKTILTWPELGDTSEDFKYVLDHIFYPLAAYCAERNGWMVFKSKDVFWLGDVYEPLWSRLLSGEFADAFCSSMEETTDKTQDLSVAARMGLWAAGSMNQWGMRTSRDNPSFDRSRQFSYQRLPNHFLRTTVWNLACGATYCGLTYVDEEHYSVLWRLVAKGALFVPKRKEIVSWSPVHLSMAEPNEHFLNEAKNNKWTVFYDEEDENENPMVFSHMNGTWPGAPLTPWDFSRYASGIKDRRQNFIPPFPHGIVLITPPQSGKYADQHAPRGKMADNMHPLYRGKMKELVTDGRDYFTPDGKKQIPADKGYKSMEAMIQKTSRMLPLTVSGDVGWVCAHTAPNHLRLTLVDGGYLNPKEQIATITFHAVKPKKMKDLLSGENIDVSNHGAVEVKVPLGLFSFIDVELTEPFKP